MTELTQADARQLTDRIKVAVEGTWQLIQEAYVSRAWAALGYDTWDAYCSAEFGTSRLRLPREERQEVVASLRESGLSTRAIASATALSEATVRRDLSGASFDAPEPVPVTGMDGKSYAPIRPASSPRPKPESNTWYGGPGPAPLPADRSRPDAEVAAIEHILTEDARRDEELDAVMENTAARFRRNFDAAMARSDDVWQFQVPRIAEVYANPTDRQALKFWLREMRDWCDRVTEALDKTVQLRRIGGDR